MKKVFVLLFVCLLAVCALAAEKSMSMTIASATTMNGHAVAPGEYKVSYVINGSTAEVKLLQGGKTIATATGEVVDQNTPAPYNAVVNQANANGSSSVIEIQFAKQKQVIRINPEGTAVGK